MSVRTTADEKLSEAISHIDSALECLEIVMDGKTWGHDDFARSYMAEVKKAYKKLRLSRSIIV